jgi:hypothetical protein
MPLMCFQYNVIHLWFCKGKISEEFFDCKDHFFCGQSFNVKASGEIFLGEEHKGTSNLRPVHPRVT